MLKHVCYSWNKDKSPHNISIVYIYILYVGYTYDPYYDGYTPIIPMITSMFDPQKPLVSPS